MTRKSSVVALLATFLIGFGHPALSQQRPQPHECYAGWVSPCYRQYHAVLGEEMGGSYDRVCKNVTAKYRCHQKIASCPEPVRTNFSRQEEGYEALRSFVCDRKAFEDYRAASRCRDFRRLKDCEDRNGPSPKEHEEDPANTGCKLIRSAMICFDELFMSDCEMDKKTAKAAFMKGENILLALEGCSSSAASHLLSQLLMLGVVVVAFSRYMNK
uniref:24 kDa family member n=1 Tax=Rhipicephalus zambeziensis TaxID=60191 RepID=A0A224Y8P0_9ACAR